MNSTCGECHYWVENECRRYPPQAVVYPTDNQHPITYYFAFVYPDRKHNSPSCGEYKERSDD